jgi:anti-anti-sigma regulatory factor
MEIIVSLAEGRVPVIILQPHGDLDASNYRNLIAKGQEVYDAGARDLLLDLSHVPYMSSSGLVALHSIAAIFRGVQPPDPEAGWGAIRAIDRDRDLGLQPHVKLLGLQTRVDNVLETVGFKRFFEVYTDLAPAVASF